jgi:hypothetical protein
LNMLCQKGMLCQKEESTALIKKLLLILFLSITLRL